MSIAEYAQESLAWGSRSAVDKYDQSTVTASTIKAKVDRTSTTIALPDGTSYESDALIFTEAAVAVGDEITLDGRVRQVARVDVLKPFGIEHHREVYL